MNPAFAPPIFYTQRDFDRLGEIIRILKREARQRLDDARKELQALELVESLEAAK